MDVLQALPTTLLLHFAAADAEEAARNTAAAKKVYEDLLAPVEAAAAAAAPDAVRPPNLVCAGHTCGRAELAVVSLSLGQAQVHLAHAVLSHNHDVSPSHGMNLRSACFLPVYALLALGQAGR